MPLRKFELLSLVGRKKPQEGGATPSSSSSSGTAPPLHNRSTQSSGSASRSTYRSSSSASSSSSLPLQPQAPVPPSIPARDGFYAAVQYERLTPSVNQRPPVVGGSSSSSSSHGRSASFHSVSSSSVQYERLTPSSARLPSPPVQYERLPSSARLPSPPVQYERLTASARLPSPPVQYERITPTTSPAGGSTLMGKHHSPALSYRQLSPLLYDSMSGGSSPAIPPLSGVHRSVSFPSPSLPSPPVLCSPMELSGPSDSLRRGPTTATTVGSTDVIMDRGGGGDENGTPASGSDKSTSFAAMMGEWMSQLRTPTPDVMLLPSPDAMVLPSPFDFNKTTPPTPFEKMEDIRRIHDALLPTPPPPSSSQRQGTKTNDYVSSSPTTNNPRPLVDDIASLCRDLISQEVSDQLAKRLLAMGAFERASGGSARLGSQQQQREKSLNATTKGSNNDYQDQDDDDNEDNDEATSSNGTGGGGGGSAKGKRRKMCTEQGCQNLSRSRGLCKAHGGGRRCSVDGCSRASQSGSLCITHGGGKRCTVDGCMKAAQSRGMCKAHGGGVRCRIEGCTKSSQGDGFCRTHGGGRRCGHEHGCNKWAQRNGMCMAHSEGRYGNSYRGRVARSGDDIDQQSAAEVLLSAANAHVD